MNTMLHVPKQGDCELIAAFGLVRNNVDYGRVEPEAEDLGVEPDFGEET